MAVVYVLAFLRGGPSLWLQKTFENIPQIFTTTLTTLFISFKLMAGQARSARSDPGADLHRQPGTLCGRWSRGRRWFPTEVTRVTSCSSMFFVLIIFRHQTTFLKVTKPCLFKRSTNYPAPSEFKKMMISTSFRHLWHRGYRYSRLDWMACRKGTLLWPLWNFTKGYDCNVLALATTLFDAFLYLSVLPKSRKAAVYIAVLQYFCEIFSDIFEIYTYIVVNFYIYILL